MTEEYESFYRFPDEKIVVTGPEFEYKLNKDGFRTKNFERLNSNTYNFLYSGCSYTFGEGIPEEYMWTNLLSNKLKGSFAKEVKDYNISKRGLSIHAIVRGVFSFCEKYGDPDLIVLFLPNIARSIHYNSETKEYEDLCIPDTLDGVKPHRKDIQYVKSFCYEDHKLLALDMLKFLEKYCELKGIKLIYSSWLYRERYLYEESDLKNHYQVNIGPHIPVDKELAELENTNNDPYWSVARDGLHPGTFANKKVSEEFFKIIIKEIGEK